MITHVLRLSEVLTLPLPSEFFAALDKIGKPVKTVEKHRQSVMNRLNIHNTASLTRYAVHIGLIDCRPQELMSAILAAA